MISVNDNCFKKCFSSAVEYFSSGIEKVTSLGSSVGRGLQWLGNGMLKLDQYTTKIVPSVVHIKDSWNPKNIYEGSLGAVQLGRGIANLIAGISLTSLVKEGVWQEPFSAVGPATFLLSFFCNFVLERAAIYDCRKCEKNLGDFDINVHRLKFNRIWNPEMANRIEARTREEGAFQLKGLLQNQKRSSLFLTTFYLGCLIAGAVQKNAWVSLGLSGVASSLKAARFTAFSKMLTDLEERDFLESKLPLEETLSQATLEPSPSPDFSSPNPSPSPIMRSESPASFSPFRYGLGRSESNTSLDSQRISALFNDSSSSRQLHPILEHSLILLEPSPSPDLSSANRSPSPARSESPASFSPFGYGLVRSESNTSLISQRSLPVLPDDPTGSSTRQLPPVLEHSLSLEDIALLYRLGEKV